MLSFLDWYCTKFSFKVLVSKESPSSKFSFYTNLICQNVQLCMFIELSQVWSSSSAGLCRRNCNKQTSHRQGHACSGQPQKCLWCRNMQKRQAPNPAVHESAKLNPCFHFSGSDRVSERSKKVWRGMGEDVSQ